MQNNDSTWIKPIIICVEVFFCIVHEGKFCTRKHAFIKHRDLLPTQHVNLKLYYIIVNKTINCLLFIRNITHQNNLQKFLLKWQSYFRNNFETHDVNTNYG
jgi:hypothetical protein